VVDGAWVFAAAVTAGIDAALRLTAEPRRDEAADHPASFGPCAGTAVRQWYARDGAIPDPDQARRSIRTITVQREQTARRVSAKLGIAVPAAGRE
jgi:cyclohexyl-isocyanide hydratase